MSSYSEAVRQNIKYYREKQGISQVKLALLCDCGTGTIGGIEAGKANPSLEMLIRIAEALKITPADLFIRDVSKTKIDIKKSIKTQFDSFFASL
jgi:putative transcriptional regulator